LTPFMGVGGEIYGAVKAGRRGIGIELKPSYYRQAVRNLAHADRADDDERTQRAFEFNAPDPDSEEILADSVEEGDDRPDEES